MSDAISIFGILIPLVRGSVVIGFLLASWLAVRHSKLHGSEKEKLDSAVFWVVLAGLLGARLGFVAMNWPSFKSNLLSILMVNQPGFSAWIGVLAAALFAVLRYRKIPTFLPSLLFGFGIAALLPLTAYLATQVKLPGSTVAHVGEVVPEINLIDLDGKPVSLSKLSGKYVVLNFWATWCPPCRREMPLLDRLAKEYDSNKVVVVGLNVGESTQTVKLLVDKLGVSYPIWTQGSDPNASQAAFHNFGGVGLPMTILVNPDGKILARQMGELNHASVAKWLPK